MADKYIKRRILEKAQYFISHGIYGLINELEEMISLLDQGQKRIMLLADAGIGKSTELRSLFKRLIEENHNQLVPIYISLDTYTNEDVLEYVKSKLGLDSEKVLNYDNSRLVFLFDEYDQVYDKSLATRKIKNFIEKYNEAYFVIACRTNFYVSQFESQNFKDYILLPFSDENIEEYATQILKKKASKFLTLLRNTQLTKLINNPFYLSILINVYKEKSSLPDSKIGIVREFIDLTIDKDEVRLDKVDLRSNYPREELKHDLKYISLIMETYQRNYLKPEELNTIQPDPKKRSVFLNLSLVRKSQIEMNDVYQFQHNNFQEYLAAEALSEQNQETIKQLVSTDPSKGKIIASWVNTLSFMFSLLDPKGDVNKQLLKWIIEIEPELLVQFERGRISSEMEVEIFKLIYDNYKEKNLRIDTNKFRIRDLARFGDSPEIISFLLDDIENGKVDETIHTAINLIRFMKLDADSKTRACECLVDKATSSIKNESITNIALIAITELKLYNDEVLGELVSKLEDSKNDWIRYGLYYLISEANKVDEFIDLFLDGMNFTTTEMRRMDSVSRLADESWWLKIGLNKAKSVDSMKKIIKHYSDNPDHFRSPYFEKILKTIINNIISMDEAEVFDEMLDLVITFSKEYDVEDLKKIMPYFDQSNLLLRAFKEIYNKKEIDQRFNMLALIANEKCFEYFIQKYHRGEISSEQLDVFRWNLGTEYLDLFYTKLKEVTGKTFPKLKNSDYNKELSDRRKLDIELVFDQDKFISEIKKIYQKEEMKTFTNEDLLRVKSNRWDDHYYSDIVLRTLQEMTWDKSLTFEKSEKIILNTNWGNFIVETIHRYLKNYNEFNLTIRQIHWIKEFCESKVKIFSFKDVLETTSTTSFRIRDGARNAEQLWYFLRKYDLEYPENVLLDMLSFDYIEINSFVGIGYLEDFLEHDKIVERVKHNLKEGIENQFVFKNHIRFCIKYDIYEGLKYATEALKSDNLDYDIKQTALIAVRKLSNDFRLVLEEVITEIGDEFKWKVVKMLMDAESDKVISYLHTILDGDIETDKGQSSIYLMEVNDMKGFNYFTGWTLENKRFKHYYPERSPFSGITNIDALPQFMKLLKLDYDVDMVQDKYSTLGRAVMSTLSEISLKSKDNYERVYNEIKRFIVANESEITKVKYLYYFLDELESRYYQSRGRIDTIEDAINKIESLKISIS